MPTGRSFSTRGRSVNSAGSATPGAAPVPTAVAVIESLDREGRGIARVEGKAIFIDGALPGEQVEYAITRRKPNYEQAQTVRVVRASSAREVPRCPYFGVCGGCSMQHLETRSQVAVKQTVLEDALARIGKVEPEQLLTPIYGTAWGYRHRARLSARYVSKKGGVLVGFHERSSSFVADMTSCEVLPPSISALLVPLRGLVEGLSIRDRMPQIEVSVGARVTVLVFRILEPLSSEDDTALRVFADAHGVQIWLQTKGPETATPFHPLGAPSLDYALSEFDIRVGFLPTDFTQVNHGTNEILVRRAMALLDPQPGERVADLFCGLGNFSLPIARRGAAVLGVEGNEGLVRRARANAAANGLAAEFSVANLFDEKQVPALHGFDKLLIDPPRDGAMELIKAIPDTSKPTRIVYVSCDPATLARDAGVLVHTKGYRLMEAGVANMFPHTSHIESIARFERAK